MSSSGREPPENLKKKNFLALSCLVETPKRTLPVFSSQTISASFTYVDLSTAQHGPSHQYKYDHHNHSSVRFTYHAAGEVTILTANTTLVPRKCYGSEREGNAMFKKATHRELTKQSTGS